MIKTLTLPLSETVRTSLRSGDQLVLSGILYTGRDAAHKLMCESLVAHQPLPFNIDGESIYYTGPTPAKPGMVIGACGPTSSYRMDAYSVPLMEKGLKVMIGKGPRSAEFKRELVKNKAIYLVTTGGIGALLSKRVIKMVLIAYPQLQSEAIYRLEIKDFPVVVAYDSVGNELFTESE